MRLDNIASVAVDHVLGRLVRRAVALLAAIAFSIVAICYFSGAGRLALSADYGETAALAIMGAIFVGIAIVCLLIWYATGRKPAGGTPALANPQSAQLLMLVEALMLGYALARRNGRAR